MRTSITTGDFVNDKERKVIIEAMYELIEILKNRKIRNFNLEEIVETERRKGDITQEQQRTGRTTVNLSFTYSDKD